MDYNTIRKLIMNKKSDIDEETLKYFYNYFYVVVKKNVIPNGITLDDLINNALMYASKIEFYDKYHRVYKKLGSEAKGLREAESKTIFIRDDLEDPLREITIYHELHHAAQTNPKNNQVGINQNSNIGRLITEAQTQYFAEEVYKEIYGVDFAERSINSEDLRMISGGVIFSNLHNYELYDNLLSKICILLEVPKDFFVSINYLYDNKGMQKLKVKYIGAKEKYKLTWDFDEFLLILDYIYCIDLMVYVDNPVKELLISGKTTEDKYEIHPNIGVELSLEKQYYWLEKFDSEFFLALLENGGDYEQFAKYIIDNKKRHMVNNFIDVLNNQETNSSTKKKI